MRSIVVMGKEYHFKVGKSYTKIITGSKSYIVPNWEVKGTDPYSFERGQSKRSSDGAITPGEIEKTIINLK